MEVQQHQSVESHATAPLWNNTMVVERINNDNHYKLLMVTNMVDLENSGIGSKHHLAVNLYFQKHATTTGIQ